MFAGKDFLSMEPPPNYRPGIGRGALGFSTRGNLGAPTPVPKFSKDDQNAAQVWASVDKRKKHEPKTEDEPDTGRFDDVPLESWLAMPEATDLTMRTKRLRTERNDSRRSYTVSDALLEDLGVDYAAMTRDNPQNPMGWINYAKQLQQMNQFKRARSTIDKGCSKCSDSRVWAFAVELRTSIEDKRQVVARAVEALPGSLELWKLALSLEPAPKDQLTVLYKAIEHHPGEASLWLQAIPLEPSKDLQLEIIQTATTFCASAQLFLLWYKLSGDVQHLDMGLAQCPTPLLWLERNKLPGCTLEPPEGDWYSALADFDGTVVPETLAKLQLDPAKVPESMQEDAYRVRAQSDASFLLPWAQISRTPRVPLERAISTPELGAEAWEAYYRYDQDILQRAFKAFPEQFRQRYFEKFGLEPQTEAEFLAQANKEQSLQVCQEGLARFPQSSQLYLLAHSLGSAEALQKGVEAAPSPELWQQLILAEPREAKRRLLIAQALKAFPVELIWQLKVELDPHTAEQAVNAFPSSGHLWSTWLDQLPSRDKKRRFREALERTNNSIEVQNAIRRFKKENGLAAKGSGS